MSASIIDKRKHPIGFRNELVAFMPTDSEKAVAAREVQRATVTARLNEWCPNDAPTIAAALGLVTA